jgi:parallel beta-helix repeat protein
MRDTTAVVAAAVLGMAVGPATAAPAASELRCAEIRVGIDDGDLRGSDHRVLQAAVDYVAGLGGGTVSIGPGRYLMRNALTLRDNVRIVGVPGQTVLVAVDGARSPLACDGDCNERQITLADPSGFRVGDGVAISDKANGGGFGVTTATLTAQVDARTFRISAPLYFDYMVGQEASARRAFPVVGGWQVKNVVIEGLTIDGNRDKAERLDGCRGGGIYLFECENVAIRHCVVRHYNGDGISFQVSQHVTVEECLSEQNAGLGLHPGSGSQYPIVRGNRSLGNDGDGLYVCWRVKQGLFEKNEIRGNRGAGISIGHKDTDNQFRQNTITSNSRAGVLFRSESEAMGAHRNTFEQNTILDNGLSQSGQVVGASIVIQGPHHELVFHENTIGYSKPIPGAGAGIRCGKEAQGLKAEENRFLHVKMPVERDSSRE